MISSHRDFNIVGYCYNLIHFFFYDYAYNWNLNSFTLEFCCLYTVSGNSHIHHVFMTVTYSLLFYCCFKYSNTSIILNNALFWKLLCVEFYITFLMIFDCWKLNYYDLINFCKYFKIKLRWIYFYLWTVSNRINLK